MTAPATRAPAPPGDVALLGVAVLAVSLSAPLIRYAAAPALAVAFWRNVLAVPVLGAGALAGRARRPDAAERKLIAVSGVLLACHFATWIPSISYTSVASSVALVATQPAWAALLARWQGEEVHRDTWLGIGIAFAGVLVLSGVDLSISPRALFGDLLALVGGVFAAAYVTVGSRVRQTVGTAAYATGCYGVASAVLLVVCLVAGRPLTGFDGTTWLAIAALVVGPQLLGHTLVNRVLRSLSATAVSVAILFEVVGATVLAALWFDETPPVAAVPAGILILVGIVVVIRAGRPRRGDRRRARLTRPRGAPLG